MTARSLRNHCAFRPCENPERRSRAPILTPRQTGTPRLDLPRLPRLNGPVTRSQRNAARYGGPAGAAPVPQKIKDTEKTLDRAYPSQGRPGRRPRGPLPQLGRRGRRRLPQQTHSPDRALRRRRHHRHRRPYRVRGADPRAGPGRRGREPGRRRRLHRRRRPGALDARRLHPGRGHRQHHGHQPCHQSAEPYNPIKDFTPSPIWSTCPTS